MPNLSAIEVAKAYLAAKDKDKDDAVKAKAIEEDTRKTRGAHTKSIQRKSKENNATDTPDQREPIQLENNAQHEEMNATSATNTKASSVAENVPKEPPPPRKQQRTKAQREREAAAEKHKIDKGKDVPTSTVTPGKPISKRRQAIFNNIIANNGKLPVSETTNDGHVALNPTTIKESQPDKPPDDPNDDNDTNTTDEDDDATPQKQKAGLKRDLSTTPSSASQESLLETSR
jgi:hypothetical protein